MTPKCRPSYTSSRKSCNTCDDCNGNNGHGGGSNGCSNDECCDINCCKQPCINTGGCCTKDDYGVRTALKSKVNYITAGVSPNCPNGTPLRFGVTNVVLHNGTNTDNTVQFPPGTSCANGAVICVTYIAPATTSPTTQDLTIFAGFGAGINNGSGNETTAVIPAPSAPGNPPNTASYQYCNGIWTPIGAANCSC